MDISKFITINESYYSKETKSFIILTPSEIPEGAVKEALVEGRIYSISSPLLHAIKYLRRERPFITLMKAREIIEKAISLGW